MISTTMAFNNRETKDSVLQDPSDSSTDAEAHYDDQNNNSTLEGQDTKVNAEETTYPEGGLRAWSVVAATSCILFCTFGYANAFGYGLPTSFDLA